jgi:hypothetical protein
MLNYRTLRGCLASQRTWPVRNNVTRFLLFSIWQYKSTTGYKMKKKKNSLFCSGFIFSLPSTISELVLWFVNGTSLTNGNNEL